MSGVVNTVTSWIKKNGIADPATRALMNPVIEGAKKVSQNNPENPAVRFLLPGANLQRRTENGEGGTQKIFDPGNFIHQSVEQKARKDAAFRAAQDQAAAPTIDSAAKAAQQTADRLRRRRGVLANIFGGQSSTLG